MIRELRSFRANAERWRDGISWQSDHEAGDGSRAGVPLLKGASAEVSTMHAYRFCEFQVANAVFARYLLAVTGGAACIASSPPFGLVSCCVPPFMFHASILRTVGAAERDGFREMSSCCVQVPVWALR